MIHTIAAPWTASLSPAAYHLTMYFLVVAGLAMVVGLFRALATQSEVSARYRTATIARLGIMAATTVSYLLIVLQFVFGYNLRHGLYVPNDAAIGVMTARYMEWSVAVPLLAVELLAVCGLVGAAVRRTRSLAVFGAFAMIFTGFLGAVIIGGGEDVFQLVFWGIISSVFWLVTTVILVAAVRSSLSALTRESSVLLRNAAILLLGGWAIYPLVYLIQIFAVGGDWTATMQISFSVADVIVKLGFGALIHRVAKLRTAEDVRAGVDIHRESIWISSVKQSDAGKPREVYLADGESVHRRRAQPPMSSAVAGAATAQDDTEY
ncbi:MAG: bacteriorhodopsin [Microbacteriaceae bacterium]|nr:bacteriorhodopsin [Microbacteriaceae bacterium]